MGSENILEKARTFNREVMPTMLDATYTQVRKAMNDAGLHGNKGVALWRNGHACPNEPCSQAQAGDKRCGAGCVECIPPGPEDRGWNLFAQTNKDNGGADAAAGQVTSGLSNCIVTCEEADFYHASHVICYEGCPNVDGNKKGPKGEKCPCQPFGGGCGACLKHYEASRNYDHPSCAGFRIPGSGGGGLNVGGLDVEELAGKVFDGMKGGNSTEVLVDEAGNAIRKLASSAIDDQARKGATAAGQAAGEAIRSGVKSIFRCKDSDELCERGAAMAGGYVETMVKKEAAEQLTYAGQAIKSGLLGKEGAGKAMVAIKNAAGGQTATAAKSIVTTAGALAGGGGGAGGAGGAAMMLACPPVAVAAGTAVVAVGVYNAVRVNQRVSEVRFFIATKLPIVKKSSVTIPSLASAFRYADTDAAPVGRHRSIPEGFQGRCDGRFRESGEIHRI